MKIVTVHYSALINLGNYSNEKIGFTAHINEDESLEEVFKQLRQKVVENGGQPAQELYEEIYSRRSQLRDIQDKLKTATNKWNATAEFLRAQGIKTDAVDMPQFDNLLPGITEESSQVVDGELESNEQLF